jgi:hypothetical protein
MRLPNDLMPARDHGDGNARSERWCIGEDLQENIT